MAGSFEDLELRVRDGSRQFDAPRWAGDGVAIPLDDQDGALKGGAHAPERGRIDRLGVHRRAEGLGVGRAAVADGVLDLFRRMRLVDGLAEEELEICAEVAPPEMEVLLRPALLGVHDRLERNVALGKPTSKRNRWTDKDETEDPGGILGRHHDLRDGCTGQSDEDRGVRAAGVEHGEQILGERVVAVRRGFLWSIRPAVAARIPGDDPMTSREIGELRLPDPRVDDDPGRHEHDRRIAGAVDLEGDSTPVALSDAFDIRVSGSCLVATDGWVGRGRRWRGAVRRRGDHGRPPIATTLR